MNRASIDVWIPGEPVAQLRPRFARRGRYVRAIDPEKSRQWKDSARQYLGLAMRGAAPLTGPVCCRVELVFGCPRSHARKRSPRPRRLHATRPDIENVLKALFDSANGVLWHDDGQIAEVRARKVIGAQDELPGVSLIVEPLAGDLAR